MSKEEIKPLLVRIPVSLHKKLMMKRVNTGVSMQRFVVDAILEKLAK